MRPRSWWDKSRFSMLTPVLLPIDFSNIGFARNPSRKNVNRPLRLRHEGHQEDFFPSAGKDAAGKRLHA
jgi:hypothetical protein